MGKHLKWRCLILLRVRARRHWGIMQSRLARVYFHLAKPCRLFFLFEWEISCLETSIALRKDATKSYQRAELEGAKLRKTIISG